MNDKCIVMGCENHRSEGRFIGDLCVPCYYFITNGSEGGSQAERNAEKRCKERIADFLSDLEVLRSNILTLKQKVYDCCRP